MSTVEQNRWLQLWTQCSFKGDGVGRYAELVKLYSEPHRHYHNLRHIWECLAEFDSARDLAHAPFEVELALWFHDAIYDPQKNDNEERSAELAKDWIAQASGNADLSNSVGALVMATKTHEPTSHRDAAVLVDVDLSILGQPPARFEEYERQIRAEYDWVPETVFVTKRAEILERFLARPRIYTTAKFFEKYEQQARRNLKSSIGSLKCC